MQNFSAFFLVFLQFEKEAGLKQYQGSSRYRDIPHNIVGYVKNKNNL